MSSTITKKRALISVSDKTGIIDFAKELVALNYEIISTGGTYNLFVENGIDVTQVSDITGFPEIMDGRVKTLHPSIHGGLLAVRGNPSHMQQISDLNITPIDIVAVNLYPFKQTIQRPDVTEELAIENIDIGGPSMLRSAAKNCASVTVLIDPSDYATVIEQLKNGDVSIETKKYLGAKVFRHTSAYDAMIATYLTEQTAPNSYPEVLTIAYEKHQDLRYGENPHQTASFYKSPLPNNSSIAYAKQLHGKELSYNNINDADTALAIVKEFDKPAIVAIKHANPCGVAVADDIYNAYTKAHDADPISIFGGIVAANREIDEKTASQMSNIFLEIIIAPSFSQGALDVLTQKKNIRLLQIDTTKTSTTSKKIMSVAGGLLVQDEDNMHVSELALTFPTKVKPTPEQIEEAKFAYTIVKYVKSNAIVLTKDNATVGIGPGQTNRIGAANIALEYAGDNAKGAILASDAFFPMLDTVEAAIDAGVKVIIHPGGSIKDEESIQACDKAGIAMIMTGTRHFRH